MARQQTPEGGGCAGALARGARRDVGEDLGGFEDQLAVRLPGKGIRLIRRLARPCRAV